MRITINFVSNRILVPKPPNQIRCRFLPKLLYIAERNKSRALVVHEMHIQTDITLST